MSEYSMEGKKKILFVIPEYIHGGTNKSLENLLTLMDKSRYDIYVYCLYEDGSDYYKQMFRPYILKKSLMYTVVHDHPFTRKINSLWRKFNKNANLNWLYKREAVRLHNTFHFDTVIGYQEGIATEFAALFESTKRITWLHSFYPSITKPTKKGRTEALYSKFDCIVCVSNALQRFFCQHYHSLAPRTVSIYNAVKGKDIMRKASEITTSLYENDTFNIISVGRITHVKQYHVIPLIAQNILTICGTLKFHWYILGSSFTPKYEIELLQAIEKYGVTDYVTLLGERDNPYPYMAKADLVACTSSSESFSYVIAESKILHTPVISNNFPVAYEVLPEECGWIASLDDMPQLLCNIINDKNGIYSKVHESIQEYKYENEDIIRKVESMLNNM